MISSRILLVKNIPGARGLALAPTATKGADI
jgi:hypothetical protein